MQVERDIIGTPKIKFRLTKIGTGYLEFEIFEMDERFRRGSVDTDDPQPSFCASNGYNIESWDCPELLCSTKE